ncbi:MAG: hypothetical protein ABI837_10400 [Acidobacteriota bacterium]
MTLRVQPFLVRPGGKAEAVPRLSSHHSEFNEANLQKMLAEHPQLLPASSLRADAGELVCIGREVPTLNSGTIDNLYLTTGGYVVVVETKLWRNPESRREVVAQVLDYVKDIVARDFIWLSETWARFRKQGDPLRLFDRMLAASPEPLDESEFIDQVNLALKRGQVLALIVGDGIQSRLQELVEHLSRGSAHLAYSLGLVALRSYKLAEGMLILPELVQSVDPIERAYVRIEVSESLAGQVRVTSEAKLEPSKAEASQKKKRSTLTAETLFDGLNRSIGPEATMKVRDFVDGLSELGIEPDFKSKSMMLKTPDPRDEAAGASLLAIEQTGRVYNPDHGRGQVRRWGWDEAAIDRTIGAYWRRLAAIDSRFSLNGISHIATGEFLPLHDLIGKLKAIHEAMREAVEAIQREAKERPPD